MELDLALAGQFPVSAERFPATQRASLSVRSDTQSLSSSRSMPPEMAGSQDERRLIP
jgi:hypothetical protein